MARIKYGLIYAIPMPLGPDNDFSRDFNKKILIIGYGAVASCTLPILLNEIKIPYKNITILDITDKSVILKEYIEKGLNFAINSINSENLNSVLSKYLDSGGLIIDLAWNLGCKDIIEWCHNNNVLYINASVGQWNPKEDSPVVSLLENTIYYREIKLREIASQWKNSPTAVVDHGANPGLISHFAKQAMVDISKKLIEENKISLNQQKLLINLINENKFGELAMKLDIKVIHCSENDTQSTNKPKEANEFLGTWSINGLVEEGIAPVEIGWGTHEKTLPGLTVMPLMGPGNEIFLAQKGIDTYAKTWVPDQEIVGMVIRHEEAFGISDNLTVYKNGKVIYRPTVCFVYRPCVETLKSLKELKERNYKLQSKLRILNNDIAEGKDTLGALVMGNEYNSWWTGSIMDINEARRLVPDQNATTIQVAAGLVAAIVWIINNPKKGVCIPDDLPYDFILKIAKPYLGEYVSKACNWTPFKDNETKTWQFENFLIKDKNNNKDESLGI